ncbi:MAG: hypothetical protein HY813_00035 [Candidatus Portnoybacteria bacterium]|nr:hypothetical protein [Candidatus Portnoybacteria bacterium]
MKKGCLILTVAVLAIFAGGAVSYAGNVEWRSVATPTNNHEIQIGANPVNPQTVKNLEQARLETGGEIFFTNQRLFVSDMQSRGGKIIAGWVPSGKAVLMRKIAETAEYAEWQSIFIGQCGNPTSQIYRCEYAKVVVKEVQSPWGVHQNVPVAPMPVAVPQPYPVPAPMPVPYVVPESPMIFPLIIPFGGQCHGYHQPRYHQPRWRHPQFQHPQFQHVRPQPQYHRQPQYHPRPQPNICGPKPGVKQMPGRR